jgi:murein DD-endopeptidase
MSRLQYPWPAGRTVNPNGRYGNRRHPITNRIRFHTGVDVGGTYPVTAAADGTVVHIGWNPTGGGHTVVIDHGDIHTAYFHGREATQLKRGDRVKAGQFIYTSGATGVATGPHLHFEVRRGRGQSTHTDPMAFLPGGSLPPKPPTPPAPSGKLAVDGVLGPQTWRAWQQVLKAGWGYEGPVDGVPGPMTGRAVQRSVRPFGYAGPINGNLGPNTRRGVQRRLGVTPDGVWGRVTISALQRKLNAGDY